MNPFNVFFRLFPVVELARVERELPELARPGRDPRLVCRWLTREDEPAVRRLHAASGVAPSYLEAALRRGDRCCGCFKDGVLAGFLWAQTDASQPVVLFDRAVRGVLSPDAVYIHHFFILPEERSSGLVRDNVWASLYDWFLDALRREGHTRGWALMQPDGLSLKIHLRKGWRVSRRHVLLGIPGGRGWLLTGDRALRAVSMVFRVLSALKGRLRRFSPARFLDAAFPRAWLYAGTSPQGGEARVLLLGDPGPFAYFTLRHFGGAPPEPRPLGRAFIGRWRALLRKTEADALYADMSPARAVRRSRRLGWCLPEFLNASVVRTPSGALSSQGHNPLRVARRDIEKRGWTAELTRDWDAFHRFYHFYYAPSVQRKFEHHRYVLSHAKMARLFESGYLLQVRRGDAVDAGLLVLERPGVLVMAFIGVHKGSPALAEGGAMAAAYAFCLDEAEKRGLQVVDFGGCHPFFDDGVFVHKRNWGVRLSHRPSESGCYWFVPDVSRPGARRHLLDNPRVVMTDGGLEALAFYDPDRTLRKDACVDGRRRFHGAGLGRLRLLPLPDAGTPLSLVPKSRALWASFCSFVLSRWNRLGEENRRSYGESQSFLQQDLRAFQKTKLARVLDHARRTVPAYEELLRGADLSDPFKALRKLPLMDRREVSLHPLRYKSREAGPDAVRVMTSGTTSHPITLWVDQDSIRRRETVRWRGRGWWGLRRGDAHGKFWGRLSRLDWRGRLREEYLENADLFDGYRLTEAEALRFIRALERSGWRYLYCYASVLYEAALTLSARGWRLRPGWLEAVFITGDGITDRQRSLIESVFAAPVVAEYGCSEFLEVAVECPSGNFHMDADRVWVEFLKEDGAPAQAGEPARIVVTDLDNTAFPFLRYPVGDVGAWAPGVCSCGRALPLLGALWGRQNDFLQLPSGGRCHSVALSEVLEEAYRDAGLPCLPWRVTQQVPERVQVTLTDPSPSASLEAGIRGKFAALDPSLAVAFDYAPSIPWTENGKKNRFVPMDGARPPLQGRGLEEVPLPRRPGDGLLRAFDAARSSAMGAAFRAFKYLRDGDRGRESRAFFRKSPLLPSDEIRRVQEAGLILLLDYARRTVPHFQEVLSGWKEGEFSWEAFRRLPLMNREDMALRVERYHSRERPRVLSGMTTSGTTSHPVKFIIDAEAIMRREAVVWRGRGWWGLNRGDSHLKIWGRRPSTARRIQIRGRWFENAFVFNSFRITPDFAVQFRRAMETHAFKYYYGYATATYEVAQEWSRRGWSLPPGRLACAILTADFITESQRQLIEEVFGCPAIWEYGCSEVLEIAMECPSRRRHISADRVIVEFLNDQDLPAGPREPGRIVVTDLDNVAMPFIRYPVGDIGSWSDEPCPCGRTLPLLHDLWGRDHAYVQLPGGGRSHSTVFSVIVDDAFKAGGYPCSLPWMVVQKSLEQVEVVLVKEGRSPVVEDYIRKQVSALHPAVRTGFQYVDEIGRTPSGKRARFFSELPGA